MNEKPTVASFTPRMAELEAERQLVRDLLSGTKGMVSAGERWLYRHPGESPGNYAIRLKGNTLTNFLAQAVEKSTNRIMSKEIGLVDVPDEIESLMENIDLQGRDLNAFAMDVLKQAFADGITYILCDKPDGEGVKTVADEKAKGIRPYAIHVKPCCLLEPRSEIIDGVQTLTRVRIMECVTVPDGEWGYATKEQVRELLRVPAVVDDSGNAITAARVIYRIWEEQEKAGTHGENEWVVVREGITAMKRIALVPVYTNRVGYMEGLPPHQATAELNLDHWRVKSEQKAALTMNCFEMFSATGVPEGWTPMVGPAQAQVSSDPLTKFGFVSPTGKGVELCADYLKDIEAQIDTASANLRVENGGRVSATAAALDSEEGCAGLKAVAEAFGDGLELMISYFAEMMGADATKTGDVNVNVDFGAKKGSDAGLQELSKIRAIGDISRVGLLKTLQWRGELDPTFDIDADAELLAMEAPPEPKTPEF